MGRVIKGRALSAVALAVTAAMALGVNAGQPVDPKTVKQNLESRGVVKAVERLPITELMMVETQNGESYFVSSNGRFVLTGTLVDTWHRRTVDSLDDVRKSHRVPLANIGIKTEELGAFVIGNPKLPKQGVIFVDPLCGYCKKLLSDIAANLGAYHFDVVPVAIMGPKSEAALKRIWCAEDKNQALLDLIYQTNGAQVSRQECDMKPLAYNAIAFEMLAFGGTPALVRTDGLVSKGVPEDLNKWLATK